MKNDEKAIFDQWRDVATDEDLQAFHKAGFGVRCGFGKRPALLVIDITNAYVDPRYPKGGGYYPTRAVKGVAELLAAARGAGIPVLYFRGKTKTALEAGARVRKSRHVRDARTIEDAPPNEWPAEIAPLPEEPIIEKTKSSAFFETPLRSMLTHLGVDTVILSGLTTSGCIQAAALDGASSNLRVIVPEECVGDRAPTFHRYALFNIDMRYGDVMPLCDVKDWLARGGDTVCGSAPLEPAGAL